MSDKVGHFDVCKAMCERNLDIRLSTLENVTNMRLTHKKRDTDITIGFQGDVLNGILKGKFIGGLLLCDAEQYQAVKEELEKRRAGAPEREGQ
jgi:hypothetical protein